MKFTKVSFTALLAGCFAFAFYATRQPTAAENELIHVAVGMPNNPSGSLAAVTQGKASNRIATNKENSTTTSTQREEATRQARAAVMCAQYKEDVREAEVLLQQPVDGANDIQLNWREESLAAINQRLTASAPACASSTNSETDIYPTLLRAARLGDMDAAVCYVQANFPLDADQLSPTALEEYREAALALVDMGLKRGDWRFVELMRMAAEHGGRSHRGRDAHSWFRRLIEPSAQIAYGYARLEQLGAKGKFADEISELVNSYREGLTDESLQTQDQWANGQYAYLFANSPALEDFPKLCGHH